jgi:hypothetical protein
MSNEALSPQQRLALSRRAIVRHMNQDRRAHDEEEAGEDNFDDAPPEGGGTWHLIKHTVRAWWRHHPAHVAIDLARPVLGRYAEDKPLKLLGIAAGIGALAVVIKPWRLVSMTGLLLATLKSSEMSGALLSMLSNHGAANADTTKETP